MRCAYIAAHDGGVDERGRRMVVRNGYLEPRQVLTSDGAVRVHAQRVTVQLGRGSARDIEVVSGLGEGELVVLSDTATWDGNGRVALR